MKPIPYEPMPALWTQWLNQQIRSGVKERNLTDTLGAQFIHQDPLPAVTVADWDAVTITPTPEKHHG